MSNPRYDWWSYAKGMVRRYPALKARYAELHNASVTANYSGMPHRGGESRPLEAVALRELPSTNQREYEAVRRAIETTARYRNGKDRLYIIKTVLWDRSHTLAGAALLVPCHADTAKVWHGDFIRLAASYYGLMDE